ncbi:MAG: restriction endonuclease subunit S [Mariprofundaceae bacterium]|nr:restriction endonuclease subunit S [Mariprofundaceae bacterium]
MNKQTKKTLVPKLRFPKFREAGEWNNELLEALYSFKVTNSFSREKLNYENGLVKNIHYGDIHTKFSTLFNIEQANVPFINTSESLDKIKQECFCEEGDMIFADASEDLGDVGKSIEIVHLNDERLLSGLHTLLARQKDEKLIVGFGGYLFKSNRIREQIKRESQGAKVLGVSAGRLSNIKVIYPLKKNEQQKIADCLSSIDELITAHTQKHDALKAHKKSLMQQLFPTEGETVPKLRFPEFQDAGEWIETKLGKVTSFSSGGTPSKGVPAYWGGDIPWISASSMHSTSIRDSDHSITEYAVNEGARTAEKGTLLLLVRGSMLHKRIPIGIAEKDVAYNQDVKALILKKNILGKLLMYLLIASEWGLLNAVTKTGIGAGKLDTNDLNKFPVYFPSDKDEQQKITDCLSSIDELIAAQSQKIESLKAHKKGLMQQLFPTVDEVNV